MNQFYCEPLDISFAIIAPDVDLGALRGTVNSIQRNYADIEYFCIADGSIVDRDIQDMKQMCPVYSAKSSVASFINLGVKTSTKEWTIFIKCGTVVRPNLNKKYATFVKNTKDVLYPIVNRKWHFWESTVNGMLLSKTLLKAAGDFPENQMFKNAEFFSELQFSKLLWTEQALAVGCHFKAILGAKIC